VSVLQPRGVRILNHYSRNLILSVVDGPKKGLRVIVPPGESRVVGRTTASHVACEDDYMSSKHFEVCNRLEHFCVRDLNSRNGTKIFDETISERSLTQSSTISAGKSVFELAWESLNEEWGTQAGSSISIRRSGSSLGSSASTPSSNDFPPGALPQPTGSQLDVRSAPTNLSIMGSMEERLAAMCLDLFHASVSSRKDPSVVEGFQRLYTWTKPPAPGESFLSDFYLTNLDFFAIASFSKLGVPNPVDHAWYPLYPSVDPASTIFPIAIPKRAWLEGCHIRWFDRLCCVDGVAFVLTDSSRSPEWLMAQLNRGFSDLLTSSSRSTPVEPSETSSPGLVPWYSPLEMLMACGSRSDEVLSRWIPSAVEGIVFPVRSTRLSLALARPSVARMLRDRDFRSASDG
jgi:hypothetical protein